MPFGVHERGLRRKQSTKSQGFSGALSVRTPPSGAPRDKGRHRGAGFVAGIRVSCMAALTPPARIGAGPLPDVYSQRRRWLGPVEEEDPRGWW